jgi:hypothetical protein
MLKPLQPQTVTRRAALQRLAAGLAVPLLAACSAPAAPSPTATNPLVKPKAAAGVPLTAVLASAEVAVGRNRLGLGLIDARNQPIVAGDVLVEYFKVDPQAGTAQKRSEATAIFRSVEIPSRGIWVTTPTFEEPGPWGAQVSVQQAGAAPLSARLTFEVRPAFSAPGYDQPAPRSATPSLALVNGDAARICSASPPCDLHDLSIQAALESAQRPMVVLFATPAICTSATCAPELSAVQALRDRHDERASFVHVEIYTYPFEDLKPAPSVEEWRLPSEPWVFVVDRQGIVRDRFEGAAPLEELEPALLPLL